MSRPPSRATGSLLGVGSLDQIKRRQHAAALGATKAWAEEVIGEAQRIAPIEEGTLAGTGEVSDPHATAAGIEIELSFNTVYAGRQHEELDWEHDQGRQAKYLEAPFKARTPALAVAQARAIAAVTR